MINERHTTKTMDQSSPRIPLALQNVFLTSCQDLDVGDAPIEVANKTFEKKIPCRRLPSSLHNNIKIMRQSSIRNFQLGLKRIVPNCTALVGISSPGSHGKKVTSSMVSTTSIHSPPKRKVSQLKISNKL
jgi:hypothetical protein